MSKMPWMRVCAVSLLLSAALAPAQSKVASSAAQKPTTCRLTMDLTNRHEQSVTAIGAASRSRLVGQSWRAMDFADVTIPPGAVRQVAWTSKRACITRTQRDLRIHVEAEGQGGAWVERVDAVDARPGQAVAVELSD